MGTTLEFYVESMITECMKTKDMVMLSCVRLLKAELDKNSKLEKPRPNQDVLKTFKKNLEEEKTSLEMVTLPQDDALLAEHNNKIAVVDAHLAFIVKLLPKPLTVGELNEFWASGGFDDNFEVPVVMKIVKEHFLNRFDGKVVSEFIKAKKVAAGANNETISDA